MTKGREAKVNLWLRPRVRPSLMRVVAVVADIGNVPVAAAGRGVAAGPGAVEAVATESDHGAFAWAHLGNINRR